MLRVIRVIEYEFKDQKTMEHNMAHWTWSGEYSSSRFKSAVITPASFVEKNTEND